MAGSGSEFRARCDAVAMDGHVHQAYSPNGAVLLSIFMKPHLFANGTEFFVK